MRNLAGLAGAQSLQLEMEAYLADLMAKRNDALVPCTSYVTWFVNQRRVVRNVNGSLPDPEGELDWSLLI